jgi:hypothetical protein
MHATRGDLRKVQYLDTSSLQGRTINLMPMWDGLRWHLWIPGPDGLLDMQPFDMHEGSYVAETAAHENDLIIPFVETMWQRASWPEVAPRVSAISADFENFATSIEKLTHFFRHRDARGFSATQFVKTELEYMFIISRSIFDLLQEALAEIWNTRIRLLDAAADARKKQNRLHDTFSKVVLAGDAVRTRDELIGKYAIGKVLADAYVSIAPFFVQVRKFRDDIVHLGKDPHFVFSTERGFCIPKSAYGFGALPFWRPEHYDNPNIVSLLPLLAHLVIGTIDACNSLVQAFAAEIELPAPIAPERRVFVRTPHGEAIIWVLDIADGESAWWSDRPRWKHRRIEQHAYFLWENRTGNAWWDPVSNWSQAEKELTS